MVLYSKLERKINAKNGQIVKSLWKHFLEKVTKNKHELRCHLSGYIAKLPGLG